MNDNLAQLCPYCGSTQLGFHSWAGSGPCPGSRHDPAWPVQQDPTKTGYQNTGSTDFALELAALKAENERLRADLNELVSLCQCAADALDAEHVSRPREFHHLDCKYCELIAQLRKA